MSKRANKQFQRRQFRRGFKRCDLLRLGMARPYRFRQGDGLASRKLRRWYHDA